jgi:hypothetical protein
MAGAAEHKKAATWADDVRHAERVIANYEKFAERLDEVSAARTTAYLSNLDQQAQVGARHHVVPRFLLERWANHAGQVQVYRRIEKRFAINNITDLAIKDFYTFFDSDGHKNSSIESLLGIVEDAAAVVIERLLNPYGSGGSFNGGDHATLGQFAAFQSVRSPRQRREYELMTEWMAKSYATGRLSDDDLRSIEVVPHPNESIANLAHLSEKMFPLFAARPIALVTLDKPLLFLGDDPVVIYGSDAQHTRDCFLSDTEIEQRLKQRRRKDRRKAAHQRAGRVVHLRPTVGRGVGVAREIIMPVSPRAALCWGPLGDSAFLGDLLRDHLVGTEASGFADQVNDAICLRALDWIIARSDDKRFPGITVPEVGPLIAVCDGVNVASETANLPPRKYRPRRFWVP